ncbi:MAG: hypothetical protein OXL37_17715 [Chloroflexota bacterium]|nr:hypothetical protein [Chloroflexota bacterium]MDE2958808.1 hypothetical protein [Chloroflexota bacterium]
MSDKMLTAETVQVIHRDKSGAPDYTINLTLNYCQESGQWVGVCEELGTSAYADTFGQMKIELREAVELQLNEMERLSDIRDYLAHYQVTVTPIELPQQSGFAVV